LERTKKYEEQDDEEKNIKLKLLGAKKTKAMILSEQLVKQKSEPSKDNHETILENENIGKESAEKERYESKKNDTESKI